MKLNEMLKDELNLICNTKIREFANKCLSETPEFLTTIPTSFTSKYHPAICNVTGGFVVHIKRTIRFAKIQIKALNWEKDMNDERSLKIDMIYCALLLHDIAKKEKYAEYWEYYNHPTVAVKMIQNNKDMIESSQFDYICDLISFHMGPWTPKSIKKPMEKYTLGQYIVYLSDYLASLQYLTVDGQ